MPDYRERVNIAGLAAQYKEGKYNQAFLFDLSSVVLPAPNSKEAYETYSRYKPELYAIGAVLAEKVVRFAYGQRNIDEIFSSLDPKQPFISLGQRLRQEVIASIGWNCMRIETGEEPSLLPAFRRLEALIDLEHKLIPEVRTNTGVKIFLEGGVNTAVQTMSNVLHTVVQVVGGGG